MQCVSDDLDNIKLMHQLLIRKQAVILKEWQLKYGKVAGKRADGIILGIKMFLAYLILNEFHKCSMIR